MAAPPQEKIRECPPEILSGKAPRQISIVPPAKDSRQHTAAASPLATSTAQIEANSPGKFLMLTITHSMMLIHCPAPAIKMEAADWVKLFRQQEEACQQRREA